jgi:hypothetical protein
VKPNHADEFHPFAELRLLRQFVAHGTPVLEALQKQTHTVPIVFVGVSDPLSAGFIPSMARPGGNITGFSNFEYAISGKWLEILHEIAPGIKRVVVVQHEMTPRGAAIWHRSKRWRRRLEFNSVTLSLAIRPKSSARSIRLPARKMAV